MVGGGMLDSVVMVSEIGLMASFLAGVVSFLSPCVLPLVPGYMSFISGVSLDELRAEDRRSEISRLILINTLMFIVGFSLIFIALGASASLVGRVLLSNQRILRYVAGTIVILFGLHLVGVLQLKWLYREKRFHGPRVARGPGGAILLGLAFGAGWSPCIGPILAGILAYAATQETMWAGIGLLAVYSAGLGIPFLLTGIATQYALKLFDSAKRFLWAVEKVGGLLLIGVGLLIFTNNFLILSRYFSFLNRFAL